jgi:glycosyltransferase involved in cell wall biosynthesis
MVWQQHRRLDNPDFATEFLMNRRFLTALPVFNEAASVTAVLNEVRRYSDHVLVVDDGSTDGTADLLSAREDVQIVRHSTNRGYGAALKTAFDYAIHNGYQIIVTIDCDGQHEPQRIPRFVSACKNVDIVSGSRYLKQYPHDSAPPPQRRYLNHLITAEINEGLHLRLTDAFCGFKSYCVDALKQLQLTEPGYGMPLQLWVEAAASNLRILELPVPLIYLDEKRSFGGALDDAETRLAYYREVICHSLSEAEHRLGFQASDNLRESAGCS